jgi:hypothetical protein
MSIQTLNYKSFIQWVYVWDGHFFLSNLSQNMEPHLCSVEFYPKHWNLWEICICNTAKVVPTLHYTRKIKVFLMYFNDIPFVYLLIHLAVCLTTGPKPLPKPALHTVRSRASSFKWEYPLLSLRSSSSFLLLPPRLPVTSISPFIFPSIIPRRRQFLRKMWPIQLALYLLISCRIFLRSLTLSNTAPFLTWSVQIIYLFIQLIYL